ncbi:MAG: acyltransferase family protein [Woeseiaceae bacterium]
MTNPPLDERLDYLDAVRAFALLLGIVFHAAISFMPIFIGWAVMDVSTSSIVPVFLMISHSFRMPLFFLVAGFFSHMTLQRKGVADFLKSRCVRIGTPFVAGWFLLRPLLVSGWIMGAESMRGDADVPGALLQGFASLGALPENLFVGTHLWFLYYLLQVTAGVLVLRWLVGLHEPTRRRFADLADKGARWFSGARLAIPVVSIATACCLWFMSHWGLDTPDKSLVPHVPVLIVYGGFFLCGWLLHRQASLIGRFARLTGGKMALCILAMVASVALAGFESQVGDPRHTLYKASFVLSYAVMMWSLVSISIGLFKRFFDRPSTVVRYVADASYWLYLIHLPIVIWLQVAVAEMAIHWSIKLAVIFATTVVVAMLLYDLVVRSTFVGEILSGRRKARVIFARPGRSERRALTS